MNFENQLKECDELYEKQDYKALIEKCDEILGQFPYNPTAMCYKGFSHYSLGESDEALKILEKGVEMNPDDCPLRNNLALVYCELGEYEKIPEALKGKL